nr:DUF805 domain-containing protein [uncultured Roseibium sp.]
MGLFLLFFSGFLFIAVVTTTPRDARLGRKGFLLRNLVLIGLGTFTAIILSYTGVPNSPLSVLIFVFCVVLFFFCLQSQVMRLQDMRRSRYFALLCYVPYLNLAYLAVLLLAPGRAQVDHEVFA